MNQKAIEEKRVLTWVWTLPTGQFAISMPAQELSFDDANEIENVMQLALRSIRRICIPPPPAKESTCGY